ncbi:MAG TPA: HEAT repeat domain-containing protein [Roseiflexaceae bacterium]|nr:HEAT repeat domain-containing protein [Roseiflexaceae bacterium]
MTDSFRTALLRGEGPLRQAEIGRAVELLADRDQRVRRAAGQALVETGAPALPALLAALENPEPAVRQSAAYLLGELAARAPDPAVGPALLRTLADPDAKVRKNSAVALGKQADPTSVAGLVERLDAEPMDYVRPSLILALGRIGGAEVRAALAATRPRTPEDERALRLALEHSAADQRATVRTDAHFRTTVDLLCRRGVEELLAEELGEAGIVSNQAPGRVRALWEGSLDGLMRFRCFDQPAFPLRHAVRRPLEQPEAVAAAFADRELLELISELSPDDGERIRYRVTVETPPGTPLRRRDWIEQFGAAFAGLAPQLENSPSRYSWEFLVSARAERWYLAARPTAYDDPRFSYRVADIPAALQPALAAAVARLLGPAERPVVLDPFCGSGTLLVEYARLVPECRLVGLDNSVEALDAARQNIAAAGLAGQAELLLGDSRRLEVALAGQPADLLITNLPYGVRVGTHEQLRDLYPAFFAQAARVLLTGGRMAFLAKDDDLVQDALAHARLRTLTSFYLDNGGIYVYLYLCERG